MFRGVAMSSDQQPRRGRSNGPVSSPFSFPLRRNPSRARGLSKRVSFTDDPVIQPTSKAPADEGKGKRPTSPLSQPLNKATQKRAAACAQQLTVTNQPTVISQPAITSQLSSANSFTVEPCPLIGLPLELAEKIYFYALASGNTSVLRLSHSSNEAASRFRFEAGIFRIEIIEQKTGPDYFSIRSHRMTTQVANLIQNVEIRIDLDFVDIRKIREPSRGCMAQFMNPFMNPSFQRDTCYIVLRSNSLQLHYTTDREPWYSLSQIKRLRGFKTVIVRAIFEDVPPSPFDNRPLLPTNPAFNRIREKLMCEMVREDLEKVFGPGVMHKGDDGRRTLEFHPV